MKKRYLFLMSLLFPLATMMSSSRAYAQTDAEYQAALAAIGDGGTYYVTTDVDGDKFFLTATGDLVDGKVEAALFLLKKTDGGEFKTYGYTLDGGVGNYFSNPASSGNIDDSHINTHAIEGYRKTWDVQVFFLGENGKYAVRATNAAGASSGWGWVGSSFWTVKDGPTAGYSFDVNYIWELEKPTHAAQVYTELNNTMVKYADYVYDYGDGEALNMGTGFGQHSDFDTWNKFYELLQEIYGIWESSFDIDNDYEWIGDGECPSVEDAQAMSAAADSMYQVILDSEVPYTVEDGYYRIFAHNRYKSKYDESGFVDKAIAASYDESHKNSAVYGTVRRDLANYIWKFTKSENGDSILIQNAGMGTYISLSSDNPENKVIMTKDLNDASYVMFDYAGFDYVMPDGIDDDRDIFAIRLASGTRGTDGRYIHQMSHSSFDDNNSPWGNYCTDSGVDQELGFWIRTYDNNRTTDKWTSEWFLEPVDEAEAEELIANFDMIMNHDVLVAQNNELREKVAETLALAKDEIKTKMITSASQMSSPFSHNDIGGGTDGGNLSAGVLIDGDKSTYWHSAWNNTPQEYHYIQISDMQDMVGDCEFYLCERTPADNDRPTEFMIYGTNEYAEPALGESWQDNWNEIATLQVPNYAAGEESTIPFYVETPYPYIRVVCTNTDGKSQNFRWFWHAAELQIYTVRENPNSQFAMLGEVAETLQELYDENVATPDEDITPDMYNALLDAYKTFLASGLVDPAEMRNALVKYANVTECVVEGTNPGQWASKDIADEYEALLEEIAAYDKAGKYNAAEIHKYAVMLKAMQKSVMEKANGVETDKWYHITFPTKEMYTDYGFDPASPGGASKIIDNPDQWGYYVVSGIRTDEMGYDDESGEEKATGNYYLENVAKQDVREGMSMYFVNPEDIVDADVSMFRFVEREADAADYTPLLTDIKENMLMALDMSTTYTRGEALITKGAQFSSNASYPGSDGQKLESGCLIDGNTATYWHSDYSKTYCEVPYLQVALNEPVSGLIQVYVARRNTNNGHVVRMYVQGSNDAETWTNVGYIETPYTNATTPVYSQPIDLGGTFSHLRFTMTNRYGTDGGSNIEFDPFAEDLTADDYNTKFTYFHASEFQIYPVTADKELSESGKALQQTYTTVNKVVLKDATAEDLATAAQGYKAFKDEFNAAEGKAILPNGMEKAPSTYAIQNKATGLFINCKGSNNANNSLETIPTFFDYKAIGYQRSLIHGKKLDGGDCTYLHSQNFDHRFVTWNATTPNSNSGLVLRVAESFDPEELEDFTFYKNIKPGRIADWCHSVSLTPTDAPEEAHAYASVGWYRVEGEGLFLALEELETIVAGQPALFIYGDTLDYDAEVDDAEPLMFTIPAGEKPAVEGATVNGLIGTLVTYTLSKNQMYFNANYAATPADGQSVTVTACSAVLDLKLCPEVDANESYDFSICLTDDEEKADGVKDISTAIENISKPGNVYSMDGKLLRTGATLNSLKAMGKGMYILNGVKVVVK